MRDQLMAELVQLRSSEQATDWAQRALGAKNTLRGADAAVVEAAFTSRLAELAGSDVVDAPLPSPPVVSHGDATFAETAEPPERIALLAALRASVELGAANGTAPRETPAAAEKSARKRRPRGHLPSVVPAPTVVEVQQAAEASHGVHDAVSWHIDKSTLALSEPRRSLWKQTAQTLFLLGPIRALGSMRSLTTRR